ncbi:hypothetical protein DFH06DRAFT_1428998 [Mycena polygramma]|nr:hypothetical protein DFH06DRAFT_1428998 [Mycena polygramma]
MSLRRPRSSSDNAGSERPTRRQRVANSPDPEPPLIHDDTFFKDGGDCYIRVANCLFKIHRYHLLRGDKSVFADMFMLPTGPQPSQGSIEGDPIVLADDSVERFCAFLTFAYAEPLDFQVSETRPDQLPTLFIALISHTNTSSPLYCWQLSTLLELSKLCGAIQFRQYRSYESQIRLDVECGWLTHLKTEFRDLAYALDTGEVYGLRYLIASASSRYLEAMTREVSDPHSTVIAPFQNHPWLNPTQRLRILSGAWSQERTWTRFVANVPKFPANHRCSKRNHATSCVQLWEKAWHRAVISPAVLAVPSGTLYRRKIELQDELKPVLAKSACLSEAFKVEELLATLKIGSDHFFDSVLD